MNLYTVYSWSGRAHSVTAQSEKAAILKAARAISKIPVRAGIRWSNLGMKAHVGGLEFWKPIREVVK